MTKENNDKRSYRLPENIRKRVMSHKAKQQLIIQKIKRKQDKKSEAKQESIIPNNQNNPLNEITAQMGALRIAPDVIEIKGIMDTEYSTQEEQFKEKEHSSTSSEGDLNMGNTQKSLKHQSEGTSWEQFVQNQKIEHFADLISLFYE